MCFAVQKGNTPSKALPIEKLMVRLRSYVSHLFRSLNALIKIKVVGFHPTPDQGGLLVCSGQLNLATALESSQNRRSDSFGLNPAL